MITDKVVFLTGASRGIGRELALRLATQQNHLGLLARNETELKGLQALCLGNGAPQVRIFAGDVSDEGVVKAAMEAFIGEFGRLDFLINNAGFGVFKPVEEIGSGEWDEVMDVNVKGTFLCCRYA
ncbi:MAG: SDR family NAD(P)-dependent oxidoreductase, partial [Saprospiraceae bacterium]